MIDREKVFDAFRNCITEPKCKDCPWEQCEQFNQKKVEIPVTLALDVIELLKEQEAVVRCKDCKHRSEETYTRSWDNKELYVCQIHDVAGSPDWFCADGERNESR